MANTNTNSYALMYEAICNSLGTNPDNFQLITPPTEWNWKLGNPGETYSEQYSFLNAMPIWNPIGKYQSGSSFYESYRTWLNTLVIEADPDLENRITQQNNILTGATNEYMQQVKSARTAYTNEVQGNDPTFASWLGTIEGKGYKIKIEAAEQNMNKQQELYNELVQQANDPVVKEAFELYRNQQYYTQVITGTTAGDKRPGYSAIPDYATWVQQNQSKGEASIQWASSEQSSVFKKSFAGGGVDVGSWFYSVRVNGKWERIEQLETSSDLNVVITFKPWGFIPISPNPWYSEATIRAKATNKNAYRSGYAPYKSDGAPSWIFGPGGILPARPTDMYVAYQPSFTITTNSSFSKEVQQKFEASTGVRIGPFTFGGSGGHESSYKDKKVTGTSFSGKSESSFPVIFGIQMHIFGDPQKVRQQAFEKDVVSI